MVDGREVVRQDSAKNGRPAGCLKRSLAQKVGIAIRSPTLTSTRKWLLAFGLFGLTFLTWAALVTEPFVRSVASTPPSVDPERLREHVRHLSVDLYPRSFDQISNIERAARYIETQFKTSGAKVSSQGVTVQELKYRNVIARFGPDTGQILVIGAHYDSESDTNIDPHDSRGYSLQTHTPGADDNASGVAGLLELASLLAVHPPNQPVELVAYTLEEPPHFGTENMGSAWHARSLKSANQSVRLMISLEMIGYFSDAPGSQHYPIPGMNQLYPDRGDFIAVVGHFGGFGMTREVKAVMQGTTDLPVFSINAPSMLQGIDLSDHRNYWEEGIPAIMITDTAFYRNVAYHGAADTFDRLDYGKMAKVVQDVYAITQHSF